jgi:hypothetical protein
MTKSYLLSVVALTVLGSACDPVIPPAPKTAQWTVEIDDLNPALLAVAPLDSGALDLIAVGGPLRGDDPPIILRRNSEASWDSVAVPSGFKGAIWWAWSSGPDDVWVVGEDLQVGHGAIDALTLVDVPLVPTSTKATLYGVWGSGPNDVWMVGGSPLYADGPEGVIFHYNGQDLRKIELTGTASIAATETLFKVWGSGPSDVMIVGTNGTALHFDGVNWTLTDTPSSDRLLTVHGRSAYEMYAVGGSFRGSVLQYDGFVWREISDDSMPFLNGVYAAADGTLWVCGPTGYVAQWDGMTWTQYDVGVVGRDFHGILATPNGVFTAGGLLAIQPGPRSGIIARYGLDMSK